MSQIPARQRASILAVVFILLLAACGQSQSAASTPQAFSVVAKEFAFTPAALTVKAGQPVSINLQNTGAVEHDWSVREIEISGEAKSNGDATSGHTMGGMGDEPKLHVAAGTGGKGTLTFTPSKPGTYEYYCTVAGHKEAGMVGTLTVASS
jgi:uncharacterized cupredoxin-like copper-binding protein